jgi:hypothetical protein
MVPQAGHPTQGIIELLIPLLRHDAEFDEVHRSANARGTTVEGQRRTGMGPAHIIDRQGNASALAVMVDLMP